MATLPNHAYVDLSLVGEVDRYSVRCHTDLRTCCTGSHRGDWIPPGSEMRLPFMNDTSAVIYQVQKEKRVILRRRNNADMPSGIYRCDIPNIATHHVNDATVRESVYVGLYATGGNCHSNDDNWLYHSNVAFWIRFGLYAHSACHSTILIV